MPTFTQGFWCAAVLLTAFLHVLIARGAPPSAGSGPGPSAEAPNPSAAGGGYVLGPDEGEVLYRANGKVVVKVDPRRGSPTMGLGTQDLVAGAGIPMHRHEVADEVLLFEQGHAHAVLDGKVVDVGPGSTLYVPHGTWHAVQNTGDPVHLVWVVTPPSLVNFFRAVGSSPGEPVKKLTFSEMQEIGRQHGTTFRPP